MTKIYILLPVFNRRHVTEKFIKQLQRQTYSNYHLVLIDDGSSDGTSEMARNLESKLDIIRTKKSMWWGGCLYLGFDWLKKQKLNKDDVVLIINDDVIINETYLETGVKYIERYDKTLLGSVTLDEETGEIIDRGIFLNWNTGMFRIGQSGEEINCLSTRGLFFKAADLNNLNGFHPWLVPHYLSDYCFTIEANNRGFKLITKSDLFLCTDKSPSGHSVSDYSSFSKFIRSYFSLKNYSHPIANFFFVYFAAPNWYYRWLGWKRWCKFIIRDAIALTDQYRYLRILLDSLRSIKKFLGRQKRKWMWYIKSDDDRERVRGDIRIHQIYYLEKQKKKLDYFFIPYDNTKNPAPHWCEYHVFKTAYERGLVSEGNYTGFLSWKFGRKTKKTGLEFRHFMRAYPGYDVYFINPFFEEASYHKNVWLQGDSKHRDFLEFSQKLFDRLDYNLQLEEIIMDSSQATFCNYWVANKKFWDLYMKFTKPFYELIENGLTPEEEKFISTPADPIINASYRAFIMERLFSTFLYLNPQIKAKPWMPTLRELKWRYGRHAAPLTVCDMLKSEKLDMTTYETQAEALRKQFIGKRSFIQKMI